MKIFKVVFKKHLDDIVAVFPYEQWNSTLLVCYSHNGEHHGFEPGLAYECPNASPEEYQDLLQEMKERYSGKDAGLTVLKRMPPRIEVFKVMTQPTFGMSLSK